MPTLRRKSLGFTMRRKSLNRNTTTSFAPRICVVRRRERERVCVREREVCVCGGGGGGRC